MANEQNLKPFPPGKSANPKGRPKGVQNSSTRLLKFLRLRQLKKNVINGKQENLTTLELMDMALIKKALKGDIIAYRELLDRFEGKAKQSVAFSGSASISVTLNPSPGCEPLKDDE